MYIKDIFIMKNLNLKFDRLRTCKHYIHTASVIKAKPKEI